jgi:pimeloyl-ACP methyl ester carboxylesterase
MKMVIAEAKRHDQPINVNSMKYPLALLFFLLLALAGQSQPTRPRLYLLAGHGSDQRVFRNLDFSGYDTTYLPFLIPERNERMPAYARRMSAQIDTTEPFALVAISLGGMIATEIADYLNPEAVVLIASAQGRFDLPWRYRFQRHVPLYKLFPAPWLKRMTVIVQPWFEPGVAAYPELCKAMVLDKPRKLFRGGIHMIITWMRPAPPEGVALLHLHGTEDTTLPLKCVTSAVVIPGGSHMMALFKPEAINAQMRPFLAQYFAPPSQ